MGMPMGIIKAHVILHMPELSNHQANSLHRLGLWMCYIMVICPSGSQRCTLSCTKRYGNLADVDAITQQPLGQLTTNQIHWSRLGFLMCNVMVICPLDPHWRAHGHYKGLPNLADPATQQPLGEFTPNIIHWNRLRSCGCATSWSFAHRGHMGMSTGLMSILEMLPDATIHQQLGRFTPNQVHWNCFGLYMCDIMVWILSGRVGVNSIPEL